MVVFSPEKFCAGAVTAVTFRSAGRATTSEATVRLLLVSIDSLRCGSNSTSLRTVTKCPFTAGDRPKLLVTVYRPSGSSSFGRSKVPRSQTCAPGAMMSAMSDTSTWSYQSPAAAPSPRLRTVQVTVKGASTEPGVARLPLVARKLTCRSGSGGIGVPMMSIARAL